MSLSYPTEPKIPERVQPGGGWGMRVEECWGALRRTLLRLFRPGYVRRMKERRLGACARFDAHVIDYRDLKYTRPACGIDFPVRPHWGKPCCGFARYGICELTVFSLLFLLLGGALTTLALLVHPIFWLGFIPLAPVWFEIVWFFRDPERSIPPDADAILSPADGTITNVEEVEEIEFSGKMLRVSIFLSIFNVHVNRMPWPGRITQVRYFPGGFLDARDPNSALRNEQLWIDAEADGGVRMRIKQISGKLARRIVCWLKPGDAPAKGERIGMIKLGSRTDLLLPAELVAQICVKPGDKVRGGKTILLRMAQEAKTAESIPAAVAPDAMPSLK
ncbi:MAG: phosphatidylserine decarboxylase [Gemmataceae bacterium]